MIVSHTYIFIAPRLFLSEGQRILGVSLRGHPERSYKSLLQNSEPFRSCAGEDFPRDLQLRG